MAELSNPIPPTVSLPPLRSLSNCSLIQILDALTNLRALYSPSPLVESLRLQDNSKPRARLFCDSSAPDSGYASAEEDDDDTSSDFDGRKEALELLRADEFERAFAIKWLIGFTARSDIWFSSLPETETEAYTCAVDEAVSLLGLFTSSESEQAITRTFSFLAPGGEPVGVELNDAPLLKEDHTSVGLQSWASSILLAERLCANPGKYNLDLTTHLQRNVDDNADTQGILVRKFDWSQPNLSSAPFDRPFDIILAADVVYEPFHAPWIANCVAKLLARPAGVLWMIIALRSGGRHEGLSSTVNGAFSLEGGSGRLSILEKATLQRIEGQGRADEIGYELFKIGWAEG